MAIKPIETEYHGYRFRSRLEARWAVYFDAVGLLWEYEPDGFRLDSGAYLPDFWLETVRTWAEVKPVAFTPSEEQRARELARMTEIPVLKLIGLPAIKAYDAILPDGLLIAHTVCQYRHEGRMWASYADDDLNDTSVLLNGVRAALGARFEFGEKGAAR